MRISTHFNKTLEILMIVYKNVYSFASSSKGTGNSHCLFTTPKNECMLCTFKLVTLLLYSTYLCSSCSNNIPEGALTAEPASTSTPIVMASHVVPFNTHVTPFYYLLAVHTNTFLVNSEREKQLFQHTLSLAQALRP